MIHSFVKLRDTFSGAHHTKIVTQSKATHDKMLSRVGTTFRRFDKAAQIAYTWEVIEVRQATTNDYEN